MIKEILARIKQKHRTFAFPKKEPNMPERFRGRPIIDNHKCKKCFDCLALCPTSAIIKEDKKIKFDLGKCIFCNTCKNTCKEEAISHSRCYKLATSKKQDLILYNDDELKLAKELEKNILKILGRSLKLRQVSAGGCNACELDTNVLNTLVFDLGRFGIQFVASPRHADGILVTGPITKNMELALIKTYEAIPDPKIVIAVGACAISGGIYNGHEEVHGDLEKLGFKVDLFIPGCPPHPYTILDGLLRLINKIKK